jgi:2-oxoglutarate dehydrogenase E1 component
VVFTPKSMLRLKAASSPVDDFTSGGFRTVIGETEPLEAADVDRVLLCSGKVYWDLLAERSKRGDRRTAIVRLEQLYPLDVDAVNEAIGMYPGAQLVWVQEEPANQGPWPFIALNLPEHLGGRPLLRISRPASASPAAGTSKKHGAEQATLIRQSFDR